MLMKRWKKRVLLDSGHLKKKKKNEYYKTWVFAILVDCEQAHLFRKDYQAHYNNTCVLINRLTYQT